MTALPRAVAAAATCLLVACAERPSAEGEVRARFDEFETALRADDEEGLLDLVTRESLPALEQIPPGQARARGALVVEAVAERAPSRFEVEVREASGGSNGTFVMVREGGTWRVDLVESAAVTHGVVDGPQTIEPAGLSEEQIDEIRTNQRERLQ